MQKKIVALAVAGLSTAAFAQTNVTIYGVADISGQGFSMSQGKQNPPAGQSSSGNIFAVQSNSSLLGFKGTEDLGNGLKALFQAETTLNLQGGSSLAVNNGTLFGAMRDSFLGVSSKYGTVQAGYLSTPLRSSLTSFSVMPGATGSSQIDVYMGTMRFADQAGNNTQSFQYGSAIRATAIAYAMPTLYGFNASIAYTGSNNNGTTNTTSAASGTGCNDFSACVVTPQSAWGFNLGWTGYGVNVQGAFQQQNNQLSGVGTQNLGDYTSYLVGASYTGIPGLKTSVAYMRNTLGTNGTSLLTNGAGKLTNNQLSAGASYRMGNWEPRIQAYWLSDVNGSNVQELGARLWNANLGYYLSKRTQVYGTIANLNNSANQNYSFAQQQNSLKPTGGNNLFTYGLGMRTTF